MGYRAKDAKTYSEEDKIYGGSSPQNEGMPPHSVTQPSPPCFILTFELFNKADSLKGMNM